MARARTPMAASDGASFDNWTSAAANVFVCPGSMTRPQLCSRTSRAISPSRAVIAIIGRPAAAMPGNLLVVAPVVDDLDFLRTNATQCKSLSHGLSDNDIGCRRPKGFIAQVRESPADWAV